MAAQLPITVALALAAGDSHIQPSHRHLLPSRLPSPASRLHAENRPKFIQSVEVKLMVHQAICIWLCCVFRQSGQVVR